MYKCLHCESESVQSRGSRIWCNNCHKGSKKELAETSNEGTRTGITVFSGRVPRGLSRQGLAQYFNIDLNEYEIIKIDYSDREVYRKDHEADLTFESGKMTGRVRDSGDMILAPLFGVKVTTRLKVAEIQARNTVKELITQAKKFSPKYKKFKYKKLKTPVLYEVEMPDLQLGRMVSFDETGFELNPKIAVQAARKSIESLLEYASLFPVGQIVFPVGHDLYDSNTADNKTAHNTPQRDDPLWQRTYKMGKELIIELIDNMSEIAPVHVPVIVGNHDEERMFYLGDSLESWYHKNGNVTVDNSGKKRKFYAFGNCLIGFTHGYWEPLKNLPHLMAVEEPTLWANSSFREWHVGDKHHEQSIVTQPSKEYPGVTVRIIRSIASPSVWEYDKGFLGSVRATESFMWHPNKGMIAQFRST